MSRIFCRCRRCLGVEAPCESWVSRVKHLWSAVQGPTAATLARRARILLEGIRAAGFDEPFITRVAKILSTPEPENPDDWRKKERVSSKDGTSRALETFREHEKLLSQLRAHPYANKEHARHEKKAPAVPQGLGREVQAKARADKAWYERSNYEEADRDLLQKASRHALWRMPLYVSTRKDFNAAIHSNTTNSSRAKEWALGRKARALQGDEQRSAANLVREADTNSATLTSP